MNLFFSRMSSFEMNHWWMSSVKNLSNVLVNFSFEILQLKHDLSWSISFFCC
jgi:hypothetical protein